MKFDRDQIPRKVNRILVVVDDRDNVANLADILSDHGYQAETACSGEEALQKIDRDSRTTSQCVYDLALLDFKMPGIDGVELYQQIRTRSPNLRAILITAYAGEDGVRRAQAAGTWQVLRKPVDVNELLDLIAGATLN